MQINNRTHWNRCKSSESEIPGKLGRRHKNKMKVKIIGICHLSPSGERICWFINFANKVTQDSTIYGQMQFLTQGRKSRFWPSRQKMYLVEKYFLSILIWLSKKWLHRWKISNVFFALHTGSNNEQALETKVKKDENQLDCYIWTNNSNALIYFCPVQKFPFKRKKV